MSTSTRLKGLAAVTASVALVVGLAGTASAQNVVPGDRYDGRTVVVNTDSGELTINEVDRDTGTVSLAFTNNHAQSLRCESPNPDESNRPSSTVSTAPVIAAGTEYYERFQVVPAGEIEIEQGLSILGNLRIYAAFWPLLQLIPTGSAAQFLSERVQLQSEIVEGHRGAETSGLAGTAPAFTVAAGDTNDFTIQLSPSSLGPRGEDEVGALILCGPGGTQGNQQLYAWSAYESGEAPQPAPEGTGSLDMGSLGSGEAGNGSAGSLGSDAPDNGDTDNGDDEEEPGNGEGDDEPGDNGNGDENGEPGDD